MTLPADEQEYRSPPASRVRARIYSIAVTLMVIATTASLRAQVPTGALKTRIQIPVIDGRIDPAEWPKTGTWMRQFEYGWLLLRVDATTLYVAADVIADTVEDPVWSIGANGDLFQLYVDINGDGVLNIYDVTYRAKPGTDTRAVLVTSTFVSQGYEKFAPTNASIAAGFGSSAHSKTPHRMWELAIPTSELTSRKAASIGLAASVSSTRPSLGLYGPEPNSMLKVTVVPGPSPTLRLPLQLRPDATDTPALSPLAGGGNTSRRILPDGTVEVTFSDGSKTQHLGGTTVRISPSGQKSVYSAISAPRPSPPALPSEVAVQTWIEGEAKDLLDTIRDLLGGDSASMVNYLNSEQGLSLYQKVDKRIRCIEFLTTPN